MTEANRNMNEVFQRRWSVMGVIWLLWGLKGSVGAGVGEGGVVTVQTHPVSSALALICTALPHPPFFIPL